MAKRGRKAKGVTSRSPVQKAFLTAYAQLGNITAASKAAGCDPSNHRAHWAKDEAYMAEFLEAQEQANDMLEAEALRRATRGTDKPVFHKGKPCGTIREYSDSLLIFLLKANRPARFRENVQHDHSGVVALKMYGQETPVDRV